MSPRGPKPPPVPLLASLTQSVDGGTDLEGGPQFDVHGGDEMLLSQQQQRLPVDFLRQELSRQLLAACTQTRAGRLQAAARERRRTCWRGRPLTLKRGDEPADFFHAPLGRSR